LKIGQYLIKL